MFGFNGYCFVVSGGVTSISPVCVVSTCSTAGSVFVASSFLGADLQATIESIPATIRKSANRFIVYEYLVSLFITKI